MRLTTKSGADHPNARFSPEEAAEIRRRTREDGISDLALAREKGVTDKTIGKIRAGRSYR